MSELRLSLLALGVGFILGLLAWEWWRRRRQSQAARREREVLDGARSIDSEHDDDPPLSVAGAPAIIARDAVREPVLGSLPVVEIGQQIDAQLRPDVDRYGLAHAETVVLDTVDIEPPAPVRVDWPDETQRRIVGLRLVPRSGTRFSGMRLRQALVGDGYLYGDLRIFHRAAADGRVVVSAASLAKPGYFEPDKMDTQTFSGLNLFTVLPGPLPAIQAFEMLLGSARGLAQRLGGELADASGAPLTDERTQELRSSLRDSAPLQRASGEG